MLKKKSIFRSSLLFTSNTLFVTSFLYASVSLAASELEPLKVSVTKVEMLPEEVAASITIITAEEIRKSGAMNIVDAVRRTAGVTIGANSSSISGRKVVQIRGMESSQALIMVDGKRVTNSDAQVGHSNFQLNWVSMDNIDHIEVVRGPMSSLYGSAGMAGVINIVTKKAGKEWKSSVDLYYGDITRGSDGKEYMANFNTRGFINDALAVKLSLETSEVKATGDKDGDTNRSGVLITEMEGVKLENINAGVVFKIAPEHQLSMDVIAGNEDRNRVEAQYYDINKHLYSVGYKGNFGDLIVDVKAYESYSDNYINDYNYHHYLTDRSLTADFIKPLSETNQLIFGLEKRIEEYHKKYDSPSGTNFE